MPRYSFFYRLDVRRKMLAALITLFTTLPVFATCSRPISVPVSETGHSVIIRGNEISGIYPEILRNLSEVEGCKFELTPVPRARLENMFENGEADLMVPATKTSKRDEYGIFVPLIANRATVITMESGRPPIKTARDLLNNHKLKIAVVRGYNYGAAYQELITALSKQGRLTLEADPVSIARLLKSGTVDATIMAPSILFGVSMDDDRVKDILDKLRYEPIVELPWGESGVYISKKSLSVNDTAALKDMLERTAKSGTVWKGFLHYYPTTVLNDSIRPR